MNQLIMKKTLLASAISIAITCPYVIAAPDQLPIINLQFVANGDLFNAGGFLNSAGTIGPFDPATDLVDDMSTPPIRSLAPGFDPLTASGNIFSFDPFFGAPWEGFQQSAYLTNADTYAFVYDKPNSPASDPGNPALDPCSDPVGVTKSSGPCSTQGSYDYDVVIAGMADEQIAVGIFFNWGLNKNISVLEVFDCDINDICTGVGIPMAHGPFATQTALFNAGLSCTGGFSITELDTPVSVSITEDVLGTDVPPSNCVNPIADDPKDDPAGLKVDGVISPTTNGGTVIINGAMIDYTPMGGFEGPDSFIVNVSDDTGGSTSLVYSVQVGGELQNNFSMLDRSGNVFGGTNDVDIVWDEATFNGNAVDTNSSPTDTTFGIMTIASPEPFFNFNWVAHNVRIFSNIGGGGPLSFEFDVTCRKTDYESGVVDCDKPLAEQGATQRFMNMTLQPGQVGAHILFDWGSADGTTPCGLANCDIDVVNVYDVDALWDNHGDTAPKNAVWIGPAGVPPATTENAPMPAKWDLVSTDFNGDGNNASPMIDGAFEGSYANFNYKPDKAGTTLLPDDSQISDVDFDGVFSNNLWLSIAALLSIVSLRRFKSKK